MMKKVKINESLMHILKARMKQKLGISSNQNSLKIVEEGKKDGVSFLKLDNGMIFFHEFTKKPLNEVYSRHVYSHYEIDKKPHSLYGIHRNHTDNLLSLKVDETIRNDLFKKMPVKYGDVVLELGAFYGFGSMKLSKLVGDNGKVISVEADKTNFEILKKNISENNISNIIPINKGIWNTKGNLTFFQESNQRNSLVDDLLENVEKQNSIEVDTVDNILSDLNIDHVDFISMEINAAEVNGLKGMKKTLSKNNIRLVCAGWYEFEGRPEWVSIKEILEEYGFSVYVGVQNRVFAIKQ